MGAPSVNHGCWELMPPPGAVIRMTQHAASGMVIPEVIFAKGEEGKVLAWLEQELLRWRHNYQASVAAAQGQKAVTVGPAGELALTVAASPPPVQANTTAAVASVASVMLPPAPAPAPAPPIAVPADATNPEERLCCRHGCGEPLKHHRLGGERFPGVGKGATCLGFLGTPPDPG